MLTSEAEKLATSSRYVPVKPSAAITSPPAAGPATALKFDARLSSDDAATISPRERSEAAASAGPGCRS